MLLFLMLLKLLILMLVLMLFLIITLVPMMISSQSLGLLHWGSGESGGVGVSGFGVFVHVLCFVFLYNCWGLVFPV